MSYAAFGIRTSLATYVSVESAFSIAPALPEITRPALQAHLGGVLSAVETVSAVLVQIAADAETRPLPPAPATLQELVAAGRARLARERARVDRDRARAASTHLGQLLARVRP